MDLPPKYIMPIAPIIEVKEPNHLKGGSGEFSNPIAEISKNTLNMLMITKFITSHYSTSNWKCFYPTAQKNEFFTLIAK